MFLIILLLASGFYQNDFGWQAISIEAFENHYTFTWGDLKGKVYKSETVVFLSRLGVLNREFEIKKDTLLSGSLIYTKVEK